MASISQAEARYQVAELVKRHPHLSILLFKLQSEGADWVTLLEKLQQAVAAKPDNTL